MKQIILFIVIVCIDQLIKALVIDLPGTLINENTLFGSVSVGIFVFIVLFVLTGALFGYIYKSTKSNKTKFLIIVITAAACSNLIDRLMRGGVVDFIKISEFPAFNIADLLITVSVIIFFVQNLNETNIKRR